ncbi:MAG: T9SS type A sorting domain-containing protein, partial [Fidelibacterota bacterium]
VSDSLRTMALELLMGEDLRNRRFDEALAKAETVLRENPGSEAEYKALFSLFNLYAADLEDKESALAILDVMKSKYPDYGLTQMAQFEMGEEVDWELAKPIVFGEEPEPEIAAILPGKFQLKPNYPNPFNPTTNISFALPEACDVRIAIYDLTGREIWRSAKTGYAAGNHTLSWNGVNQSGANVVSGIYLVRMVTPKYSATQRILLMK